jgi:hypothetical protein
MCSQSHRFGEASYFPKQFGFFIFLASVVMQRVAINVNGIFPVYMHIPPGKKGIIIKKISAVAAHNIAVVLKHHFTNQPLRPLTYFIIMLKGIGMYNTNRGVFGFGFILGKAICTAEQ